MIWRRVAEMLHFRHAVQLEDERATKAKELLVMEAELATSTRRIRAISADADRRLRAELDGAVAAYRR